MSYLRLHVILSHLSLARYSVKTKTASNDGTFVWNPPEREVEIKDGERITIRAMKESDVVQCLDLIKARKSVHFAESDITCGMQYSGFIGIVAVHKNGQIIGCLLSVIHRPDVRTSGYATVHQEYRKRGILIAMGKYSINNCPVVGDFGNYDYVTGNQENSPLFQKGDYYIGDTKDSFVVVIGIFRDTRFTNSCQEIVVKGLEPDQIHALSKYDQSVHVVDREGFLKAVCFHDASRTYVAYQDETICGYGVLRRCYSSHKISPLFADSPNIARRLYQSIARDAPYGCSIVMIVPWQNQSAMKMIEENEFTVVRKLWRLRYRNQNVDKPNVNINYSNVFAMTDCSLSLC